MAHSDRSKEQTRAIISVIRTLGFIGNAHYCPYCMNHFHDDRGQHELDCEGLANMKADDEWWEDLDLYLSP
ncbi:MAG TPA: hypothetical protein VLA89_12275 [Gemmatimonadales bacterium]|nr:hypothetical protein [Gemmatimonadales bacterium]